VRKCASGSKIGPLVAKDADAANRLMAAAAQCFPGPVSIDLPQANLALTNACLSLGMEAEFATTRMYRGPAPTPGTPHRAIATLELG